jgi:hypothetical protein
MEKVPLDETQTVVERLKPREKVGVTELLPYTPLVNVGILVNVLEAEILDATLVVAERTGVNVDCGEAVL